MIFNMRGVRSICYMLLLIISGVIGNTTSLIGRNAVCNTKQVEDRLKKLEKRLQSMEYAGEDVRTAFEELRRELDARGQARLTPRDVGDEKSESCTNNLNQGMLLVVETMTKLKTDIDVVERNLDGIKNTTSALLLSHDNLSTKNESSVNTKPTIPRSCKEILEKDSNSKSGIYIIQPEKSPDSFLVNCDMTTRSGGWTIIQNRVNGYQDFDKDWETYKLGFGNLLGEYWLGLDHIHHLTGYTLNELLVELVNKTDGKAYAIYDDFNIGSNLEDYQVKALGYYSGNAGDSFYNVAGCKFSTKDRDRDNWAQGSCAINRKAGWWHNNCGGTNLNGPYQPSPLTKTKYQGMYWVSFGGAEHTSLKETRMLVRERRATF